MDENPPSKICGDLFLPKYLRKTYFSIRCGINILYSLVWDSWSLSHSPSFQKLLAYLTNNNFSVKHLSHSLCS